jgi:hypothetical protein
MRDVRKKKHVFQLADRRGKLILLVRTIKHGKQGSFFLLFMSYVVDLTL